MKQTVIVLGVVALVALVSVMAMIQFGGRPVSTDLSQVGGGTPALVLAHENYAPASMAAMDHLNRLRGSYGERVLFLVADTGVPAGRAFVESHGLVQGMAILLAGDGSAIGVVNLADGESDTEQLLAAKIAALDGG